MAAVAGNLSHGERSDLRIITHEMEAAGTDRVVMGGGVGRRIMAEEAEEGGLRQEVSHFSFGSQCGPLLDDMAELAALEINSLGMNVPTLIGGLLVTPEADIVPLSVHGPPEHLDIARVRRPVSRQMAGLASQRPVLAAGPPLRNHGFRRYRGQRMKHLQGTFLGVATPAEPGYVFLPERGHRFAGSHRRRSNGMAVAAEARSPVRIHAEGLGYDVDEGRPEKACIILRPVMGMAGGARKPPLLQDQPIAGKFVTAEIGKGIVAVEVGQFSPGEGMTDNAALVDPALQISRNPGLTHPEMTEIAFPVFRPAPVGGEKARFLSVAG